MNKHRIICASIVAMAATLAMNGCSSPPARNAELIQAHSDFRVVQASPQASSLAGGELKQASDALGKADAAWERKDRPAEVDHLAYLARQRVAIAQAALTQKSAEVAVANAESTSDKVRLAARTSEADTARLQSANAQQDSAAAQARSAGLEAQLKDLRAKKTERGMVITIGDVLFDTDRAELKAGGMRNLEKLSAFLKQYPQRNAMIEGFTDSTGSDEHNQTLSGRRADAVRSALVGMGIGEGRLSTHGYGEAYPVAGNGSRGERQMNRRVEVVLSDDSGVVTPR